MDAFGQPVALTFDEPISDLPEPQRSDFQIMIDERVDELVHRTMNQYRDLMWKEMAQDHK